MTGRGTAAPRTPDAGRRPNRWSTSLLVERPLTTAVLYSVVASFPLFFAGGYAIRLQQDLAISKSQFGLAISAYFAASAVGSFTIGKIVDRRGVRVGFVAAGVGGALAAALVAVAGSFLGLALALGLGGLANTAGQLASNRSLAGLGAERQGTGFGVKQAAVPFGGFCAGLVVSLVGTETDWRAAFAAYALLALAIAAIAPAGTGPGSTDDQRRPVGGDWPFLLMLATAGGIGGAAGNGLAVLTVDAFGVAGYDETVGAAALAAGSAVAIVGRASVGWLAGRRHATGFSELAAAMALGAIGFGVMAIAGAGVGLLWVGAMVAFLGAWGWPGVMYYTVVRNASTTPGTATGVVVAGVFLGGIAGTPALATIADRWSYGSAWGTASAMTSIATVLILVARRLCPDQPASPSGAPTATSSPLGTTSRHPNE